MHWSRPWSYAEQAIYDNDLLPSEHSNKCTFSPITSRRIIADTLNDLPYFLRVNLFHQFLFNSNILCRLFMCFKLTWTRTLSMSMKWRHFSLINFLHTVVDALPVQPIVGLAPHKSILVSRVGIDATQMLPIDHNIILFMDYLAK